MTESVRFFKGDARSDTAGGTPVLFPERLEPEQDRYVHENKECNADIAPDGGLEKKQSDLESELLAVHIHDSTGCYHCRLRRGASSPACTPLPRK